MSWQDAHRYRGALRTAEADLDRTGGELIWRPDYVEVFGSRARLWQALRSYWRTLVEAQADWDFEFGGPPSRKVSQLAAAHPGLTAALGIVRAAPPADSAADLALARVVLEGAA